MDPNANLSEQRRIIWSIFNAIDRGKIPDRFQVNRLCELSQALDEWMSSGGFSPWEHERKAREVRS